MSRERSPSNTHLEIPRKSVELEDTGAHELSSEDEYFSDASEGRKKISRPVTPSSPIPTTRVERVDENPAYGEVPGTAAYEKRTKDAVPDEVEVVPEGSLSKRGSRQFLQPPLSPGGTPVPKTVVEKVDPSSPSYGDVPGTQAYKQRIADAPPDLVLENSDPSQGSRYKNVSGHKSSMSTTSIPETIVTRVDDDSASTALSEAATAAKRKRNTSPDMIDKQKDTVLDLNDNDDDDDDNNNHNKRKDDADFGEDFDDFEAGAEGGVDDDFGDFDDFEEGVEADEPAANSSSIEQQPESAFPLIDMNAFSSLSELLEATKLHLDAMFPTTVEDGSTHSQLEPIPAESPIFPSERSRSLWTQLITPAPLQPPNWTQSRIRRLFLISLGVPVDLDEILPPSKQKKLILPDIHLPRKSFDDRAGTDKAELNSVSKLKSSKANDSSASVDSQQSASKSTRGRTRPATTKSAPAPPPLDLTAVKRICATTDEKLEGFTDEELQAHVKELESLTEKTSHVLEFWLKKRDGLRKEKEAFEGVIENLVRHLNRVRKIK